MHYGAIKDCDIANGEGVRVTLFVSGCTNRCPNCFQPQTWDFEYGEPFTVETEEKLLEMLRPAYINGLTLLGGRAVRAGQPAGTDLLSASGAQRAPQQEYLGIQRLYL